MTLCYYYYYYYYYYFKFVIHGSKLWFPLQSFFYCLFPSCITEKENLNRSDEGQKEVQTEVN